MAASADELLLLERVFLRIGSADTDEQLQNAVSKFLPPVLLKLSSQQEGVRKKVMELLVHINKRIKSRPQVQLPVEALLLQYQDPSARSFVTNFTIIYIKMGFPRLPIEKQAELVPSMLNAVESKPQSHQDSLLMLIIPLLGSVEVPRDPEKRSSLFGLNEKPHVAKLLSGLMLDMLLLPYGATMPRAPDQQPVIPPGMSQYTFKRVTADSQLKPEDLERIKVGIVKFLTHGVLPESEILLHLIVAAADTRFSVANLADLELKKMTGSLDWTSASLAMPLYRLFLGSQGNVKPENKKSPANTRIRLKLLQYLRKFTGNGFIVPSCIQVIFDSLYGTNTNTRLKTLALNFTTNIIQYADSSTLEPVARLLLCGLTKLTDEGEVILQSQAYIIIGLLGRRLPSLVTNDLQLLENLFKKLDAETPDIRLMIREGMLNLVSAYKYTPKDISGTEKSNLDNSRTVLLYSLLSQYIDSKEDIVRFVAARYMAVVFNPQHIQSRFLLLLATGDGQDNVSTEAFKALYGSAPNKEVSDNKHQYSNLPPFKDMVQFIYSESLNRVQKPGHATIIGTHVLPFTPRVFKEILIYLRLCSLSGLESCQSREIIRHPTEQTPKIRKHLEQYYVENQGVDKNPILQYLYLLKTFLKANQTLEPLLIMLELVGCVPKIQKMLADDLKWIKNMLSSTKEEIREYSSILYGILIANNLNDEHFDANMKELKSNTENNKAFEVQHGSLLGLANSFERRIMIKKIRYENIQNWQVYRDCVNMIYSLLVSPNSSIVNGATHTIGLLGSCSFLPLSNSLDVKPNKKELVEVLLGIMNNVKLQSKIREKAARTLGLICVGEMFPFTKEVIEGLLKTAKDTKDVEVHFTVGESLVMCVQSIWSAEARDAWTVLPEDYNPEDTMMDHPPDENLKWLLDQVIYFVSQPHPNSRQASCIWLLSLLKKCSNREPVRQKLSDIQNAFMELLSENNDIVVDVASKGLGLVFECSDQDMGQALLDQLVSQLQTGRKTVAQVTSDTKLFEEGELGTSPTGGNLSTYKELCSLASDLNKPDLIYKFMQLANHNTIWNSKKGAAFGFLTIATKAGEQLKPHLPKIIPRLYRYQFDPTPNLQNSMQRIWHALVPETQSTLDEYQKEILTDLIQNLTAQQWRIRQSACLALQDFFRGGGNRSIHDCTEYMNDLWTQLFRVMDDVHEGTRIAATNTAKILSKLCILACDAGYGKLGAKMIESILPVLLTTGITNTVAEVRAISLQSVSELVGTAGEQMKEFLPLLIPALLQATGELESSKLSRLSTMFGAETHTQEAIDTLRASAAKSHYTTETAAKCLQYADSSILEELVPKVLDLMKGSVGLGTRIACAHFITLLTMHVGNDLQPYTGKFLSVLVNGLTDRNTTVRKHYASAIGHLVSTAKESSIEKLFSKLRTWYFEKEDDSIRCTCAQTIEAIGTHNQEILKDHANIVLPLVFFAMHEEKNPESEHTVEMWCDIWNENSSGTEAGIRQNIEAICEILQKALESPSWHIKAQAANAVSTVATKLGSTLEQNHRNMLLKILISGLSGRTWKGKERLLKALASICCNCSDSVTSDQEMNIDILVDAVMKECRKDDIVYKRTALECVGDILDFLGIDRFEELYTTVQSFLSKDTTNIQKDEDEDLSVEEANKKRENLIKLKETVYETLGKAWPKNIETQEKYAEMFVEHCVSCLPSSTRSVQVSVVGALCLFVDKSAILINDTVSEKYEEMFPKILDNIYAALNYALNISKHTRLRKEALNVILSLAKKLKDKNRTADFQKLKEKFYEMLPNFEKDNQPEIKSRMIDLKDIFNK